VTAVDRRIADLDGLPRKNGELVFEAPWQSRAFGMAVALYEQRAYEWESFRQALIAEIERRADDDYYASWLGAFEKVLLDQGTLSRDELERRRSEFLLMQRDEIF